LNWPALRVIGVTLGLAFVRAPRLAVSHAAIDMAPTIAPSSTMAILVATLDAGADMIPVGPALRFAAVV
jgi:hypothetical protein